jgi:hypothetical protein
MPDKYAWCHDDAQNKTTRKSNMECFPGNNMSGHRNPMTPFASFFMPTKPVDLNPSINAGNREVARKWLKTESNITEIDHANIGRGNSARVSLGFSSHRHNIHRLHDEEGAIHPLYYWLQVACIICVWARACTPLIKTTWDALHYCGHICITLWRIFCLWDELWDAILCMFFMYW